MTKDDDDIESSPYNFVCWGTQKHSSAIFSIREPSSNLSAIQLSSIYNIIQFYPSIHMALQYICLLHVMVFFQICSVLTCLFCYACIFQTQMSVRNRRHIVAMESVKISSVHFSANVLMEHMEVHPQKMVVLLQNRRIPTQVTSHYMWTLPITLYFSYYNHYFINFYFCMCQKLRRYPYEKFAVKFRIYH